MIATLHLKLGSFLVVVRHDESWNWLEHKAHDEPNVGRRRFAMPLVRLYLESNRQTQIYVPKRAVSPTVAIPVSWTSVHLVPSEVSLSGV